MMNLTEAIAGTWAVLNGQPIEPLVLDMFVQDLEGHPLPGVLQALNRCRSECKRLTLVDILERIPGGHVGAEVAWSCVAKALNDERVTILVNDQIFTAFGVALLLQDDPISARMAFKEKYLELRSEALSNREPPKWRVSLGADPSGREGVVQEAVRKGLLTTQQAQPLLPYRPPETTPWLLEDKRDDNGDGDQR